MEQDRVSPWGMIVLIVGIIGVIIALTVVYNDHQAVKKMQQQAEEDRSSEEWHHAIQTHQRWPMP
jgi:F0F1-type ATP synthase assembly protein I